VDDQTGTTTPSENKSVNWWGFLLWAFVFLLLYALSAGPFMMSWEKGKVSRKGVFASLFLPVGWAYKHTPLHRPLGMYFHLWAPKMYYESGEQNDAQYQYYMGYRYLYGQGVAKDQVKALKCYHKAAAQNYAEAENALGYCYWTGLGVAKDYVEAANWYRKAAEQNHVQAEASLSSCYLNGQGVAKDYEEAVKWLRKAAEQTNAYAEYALGKCYHEGRGIAVDYGEAVRWFRKAAEQNQAEAQYMMGLSYALGQGVERNADESVKWYRRAAEQGNEMALTTLANYYYVGMGGVPKDTGEALKWYRISADRGDWLSQNYVAWILATSSDPKIRDGRMALDYAEKVVAASKRSDPNSLDTLAAAYAESGQFTNAVRVQKEAMQLLHEEEKRKDFESRLRLYELNTAYRDARLRN
jgi:TPR repeat protein